MTTASVTPTMSIRCGATRKRTSALTSSPRTTPPLTSGQPTASPARRKVVRRLGVGAMRRDMSARLITLGVLGFLAGAGAFWITRTAVFHRPQIPDAPVALLVGWSFIGSGLLSWRAQPDNRLGPVMVLTGFAWYASVIQEGRSTVLFTIGLAFQVLYLAGFLYVILSFPSGRLQTALDRALVIAAFGLVTIGQLAWMIFADTRAVICDSDGCLPNLLEVHRDDTLAHGLLQFQRIAGLVVIAASIGLLAVRLVRASRPQRHAVIPVLLAGCVAL